MSNSISQERLLNGTVIKKKKNLRRQSQYWENACA